MSEIKGAGLSTSTPLPTEISVSDFGGLTPAQYAAAFATAFNPPETHTIAQLSSTTLGDTVTFAGIEWTVVHVYNNKIAVLALKNKADTWKTPLGSQVH